MGIRSMIRRALLRALLSEEQRRRLAAPTPLPRGKFVPNSDKNIYADSATFNFIEEENRKVFGDKYMMLYKPNCGKYLMYYKEDDYKTTSGHKISFVIQEALWEVRCATTEKYIYTLRDLLIEYERDPPSGPTPQCVEEARMLVAEHALDALGGEDNGSE